MTDNLFSYLVLIFYIILVFYIVLIINNLDKFKHDITIISKNFLNYKKI